MAARCQQCCRCRTVLPPFYTRSRITRQCFCLHLRLQTRQNFGVVELDGLIYVLGGENEVAELTTVEVFDPHFNTWKPQTSMTMVRSVSAPTRGRRRTHAALVPPPQSDCDLLS